jgi:hypothetical protein
LGYFEGQPVKVVTRAAGNACRAAALAGALFVAGCAGSDVPVPFMDLSLPNIPVLPASHPANSPNSPQSFPAIAPPAEREDDMPVMNDVERIKLEDQLRKLSTEREAQVKQRIERAN